MANSAPPDRNTTPPTSEADESARIFERLIRQVGESAARWERLMALLAERENAQ